MTPQQRAAQELLPGEQPEEHTIELPGNAEARYIITIERIGYSVVWRCQVRFTHPSGSTVAAPNHGRGLKLIAVVLLEAVGQDRIEWWRYDRAHHIGQLAVCATGEEVEQCLALQEFDLTDIALGTITEQRTKPPRNQN